MNLEEVELALEDFLRTGVTVTVNSRHGTWRGKISTDVDRDMWEVDGFRFEADEVLDIDENLIEVD